ncbi:MAG: restriction endonuclease subunit S [Eubacteriales bacterium]|jgi:type I restriction enzyme S subunit
MTPEIKKRIEQIRCGEVPERYKRTNVGILPEEWNVIHLSKVLKKQTQKNIDSSIAHVLTNSATQGIVDQIEYFDKQIANDDNINGYYIVKNGYFVYNPRISANAPCGPFNRYNGTETGIMSPLYTVYKFIGDSYCSEFLTHYFDSTSWHRYMNNIANYGARSDRMNVTSNDMNLLPLPNPPLPEQQKIAAILTTQDRIIALQQQKIEEIQRLKKACLTKMFPKKGSTIPEIRFPGFNGSWERRRLGDVVKITMGQSPDGSTYSEEPSKYILVQGNADIQNGWVSPRIWTTQVTKIADAGDLIMSVRAPAGKMGKTAYNVVIGRGVAAIKGNEFIFQALLKMDQDGYWKKYSSGSTFESLNSDCLKNADILIPSAMEQNKVGTFFNNLDNLITLHERKLEEMQKFKKALMQLLLTGIVRVNV